MTVPVGMPVAAAISIGEGHELEVATERVEGNSIRVKVRWVAGGRPLMSTVLVLRAGGDFEFVTFTNGKPT